MNLSTLTFIMFNGLHTHGKKLHKLTLNIFFYNVVHTKLLNLAIVLKVVISVHLTITLNYMFY